MAEEKKIATGYVGNALRSSAADHTTTFTDEVFDTERQKYQSEVNTNIESKIEEEAKARELAITTEEQARTQSDQFLSQAIAAEQERAEAAEQANATAINTQKQKLSELEGEVETKVAINSINLIDENAISEKVVGLINPDTGTINTEITSYVTSGFISVKPNTTYYGNKDVFRSLRCVAFYNDNKLIPSDTQNVDSFTTPANCNRVRICTSVNNWDILSLSEGKAYSYVPFNPINGYLKDVDNTLETLTQEIQDSKEDVAKINHIINEGFVGEFELISGTFIERFYWEINKAYFSTGASSLGIIYFTVPKYGKLKVIQNSDNPNIAYGFIGKVNDVSDIVLGGTVINVENYGDVGSEHIIEVSAGDIICIQTRYLAKNDGNYKVYFCVNMSLQEKIAELDSEVKPLISTYEKYNHDYASTTWTNGLVNIKGETTSSPYYKYSNRISVNQGDIVWASKGGDLRCVCAYDANGSVVQAKGWFGNNETRFIVPSGIASVVVSIPEQMASGSSVVVSTKDVISDVKLPTEEEAYLLNQDILYGKKWAVFGDSFTEGQNVGVLTDGKYFGRNKSYPYIIANRHNMEIINYFLGGRTIVTPRQKDMAKEWSYNANRNYITLDQMYANVPSDVDYITIYIGINDSHLITSEGSDGENYGTNVTADMGTIDSTDITTFYGAFNTVIQWFLTNRPFAHLGIIVSNGMDTDDFRLAEIEIAKKWGIPYIDLNGDDKTPMMHRSSNPAYSTPVKDLRKNAFSLNLASGNQHPNAMAYEFESTFIEAWMKTL